LSLCHASRFTTWLQTAGAAAAAQRVKTREYEFWASVCHVRDVFGSQKRISCYTAPLL